MDSDHFASAAFSLISDGYGHSFSIATALGTIECGQSVSVSGTTSQLGESDWLQFTMPSTCTQARVAISGSGGETFDVITAPDLVVFAGGGPFETFLTSPGTYYIRIYNDGRYTCNTGCGTGLWTITIAVT